LFKSLTVGMLNIESIPKTGTAIINEATINAKKLTRITKTPKRS
jgi:hypothetical protein